ncbi:MFS transporter [bacterium]|nr:MFS transporter [bacterium]
MFGAHRMPVSMRVSYECDSKAGFCYGLMYGSTISYFTYVALKNLSASDQVVKLLYLASFFGATATIFWTRWFQTFRKLPLVVWTKGVARALLLLLPLATGAPMFAAIVFAFWTIELMASPAYSSIMKEVYLDSHRGLAMGYVRVHVCLGQILGALFSGFILHEQGTPDRPSLWDRLPSVIAPGPHNFDKIVPFGVAAGLVGLVFFHRLHQWSDQGDFTAKSTEPHLLRPILALLRDLPALRYAQIALSLLGLSNLMCMCLYPVYQVEVFNIRYEQVAVLTAVASVCGITSYYVFGSIVDRRNLLAWHAWTFMLFMAATVCYLVTETFAGLVVATMCQGLGSGGWDLVRNNFLIRVAPHHRPQPVFTLDLFLMGLRGVAAPFLAFWLCRTFSFQLVFWINLVVGAGGCAAFLWMGRRYTDGRPAPRPPHAGAPRRP